MCRRIFAVVVLVLLTFAGVARAATPAAALADRVTAAQDALIEQYDDPTLPCDRGLLAAPADVLPGLDPAAPPTAHCGRR